MRDAIAEFMTYNRPFARRNPELLRFKIARMAESPFAFFRGTFHLFAHDVIAGLSSALPLFSGAGAELDLVGDLHSENYGTYKANDGLVHYDVNDFDETTTGRFDFDVCRLATSHLLAAQDRGDLLGPAIESALAGVSAYAAAIRRMLGKGKAVQLDVSEMSRCGCVSIDALIAESVKAKRGPFIDKLTEVKAGKRRFVRTARTYNLPQDNVDQAHRLLGDYRKRQKDLPEREGYFNAEDVCGRVSGIGSMGRLRYLVLLAGKGSDQGRNVVLEFKESLPSAYDVWRDREKDAGARARRAERVVAMQTESQAASNRFVGRALDGEQSFQVRQLGPSDNRVEAKALPPGGLASLARVQAEILARVHARSAARAVGPTNPLAELAEPEAFCQRVLAFALAYADVARRDWTRFSGSKTELDRVEQWMNEPS